ncbi:hypothetical protein PRIC1_004378 [Phytophthora ramorum]
MLRGPFKLFHGPVTTFVIAMGSLEHLKVVVLKLLQSMQLVKKLHFDCHCISSGDGRREVVHELSNVWKYLALARFKKRHGLHRSQRTVHVEEAAVDIEVEGVSGVKRTRQEVEDGDDTDDEQVQKVAVPPLSKGRKQFVSADDILLLTQVLQTKPWAFQHVMDGWQQVSDQLRAHDEFRLEKTAGACQARVVLLLDHLRAGNAAALRKAGTSDEYERKRELLVEVQAKQTAFEEVQEDVRKRRGEPCLPLNITQHDAAVAKVGEVAAAIAVAEATGEADRDSQRRLELLEIKMERELAEQRRHADEQVRELERLQRVQLEAQQNQHAQLLATIQQQQAMMLDLIKSVAAQAKNKE